MRAAKVLVLLVPVWIGSASPAQTTTRVSVSSSGAQSDGDSRAVAVSDYGRFVAFKSLGTTLVPGDSNGFGDVFLHDRVAATTEILSISSLGVLGNGESYAPTPSRDAHWVAFFSQANNLATGDTNGRIDVFLRDRATSTTTLISRSSSGVIGNEDSDYCSISLDGNLVAFRSAASNLVPGDTYGQLDIFVRDVAAGTATLASVTNGGAWANGNSQEPMIAGNGRFVVFSSDATNLVTGDTNGVRDVFVRDMLLGTTIRASVSTAGVQGNQSSDRPTISADGRYVAFDSNASNLAAGDVNGTTDIFLHDVLAGTTTMLTQGDGASVEAGLTSDGQVVVFTSAASNLIAGDTNQRDDIFALNLATGALDLKSVDDNGAQANGHSRAASVSLGGQVVAYRSDASNLVPYDTNAVGDVFASVRQPVVWYVDVNGTPPGSGTVPDPYTSIQYAISQPTTVPGDTVLVLPGTYVEAIDFLGKDITVEGSGGAAVTTIAPNQGCIPWDPCWWPTSVAKFESGETASAVLRGVTLTTGGDYADGGGARIVGSSPSLDSCVICNNFAMDAGGGIHIGGGSPTLQGCAISGNEGWGYGGGGVNIDGGSPTFVGCSIDSNLGGGANGLRAQNANVSLTGCSISGNGAGSTGSEAAFVLNGGTAVLNGCVINGNGNFWGNGLGIGLQVFAATVTASNCDFSWNGCGIVASGSTLFVDNSTFNGNYSGEYSGCGSGAGISAGSSTVVLDQCNFGGNQTYNGGSGGAIDCGQVSATRCSFVGNFASGYGGAACAGGGFFDDCVFSDNLTEADWYQMVGGGDFGAVYAGPGVTIRRSVFTSNEARGGYSGPPFCGAVGGGAILENCTLTDNLAPFGSCGAVGDATMTNCIVWNNTPATMGGGTTATYCDLEFPVPGTGNFSLDPLFWNGLHLRPSSPCIDAGDPSSPADPDGSVADVGAYPFDYPAPATYCTAGTTSNGCSAAISATGTASGSAGFGFTISVSDIEANQSGIIFYGIAGAMAAPWGTSTSFLCVKTPLERGPVQNSGVNGGVCSGVLSIDWNQYIATHPGAIGNPFIGGETVWAQGWFRDPPSPKATNLSNALEFAVIH